MMPPADVMNQFLQHKQSEKSFESASVLVEAIQKTAAPKSTKVMETELRSLQDKILDLETKLNVTSGMPASKIAFQPPSSVTSDSTKITSYMGKTLSDSASIKSIPTSSISIKP